MRGEEVDMRKLMKEKNKAFAAMRKMKAGKAATPQQVRRQSADCEMEPIVKAVPLMDGSAASGSAESKPRQSDARAKLILEQMKAKKRRTLGQF